MKMEKKNKDPLPSMVMTGYNLTKARKYAENAIEYLWRAHECAMLARSEMVADDASEQPWNNMFGTGLEATGKAIGAMHTPAVAHDIFRRLIDELGYREINNEDFSEHGGGGGR